METGTPHKKCRPKGAAHKLIISFSVTSMRRLNAGAQGGETFPSRSRLRRVARGKGFPALRPVVGENRLHARETAGGGGAHKCQDENHERPGDVCQHAHYAALKQPTLKVRGDVTPNTPQQDAHTDDAWDIEQ